MRGPRSALSDAGVAALAAMSLALMAGCTAADDADAQSCLGETGAGEPVGDSGVEAGEDIAQNPESASGYRAGMEAVEVGEFAVVTANPEASRAACEILADGGTAADALVAAQAVLGLVEPQSSGIGGGTFVLYYDAEEESIQAYDGRETAPAGADENYLRWISEDDRDEPVPSARASGRSIGVPGTVRLLEALHEDHGETPWGETFASAIDLAGDGFTVSPRLAGAVAESQEDFEIDPELSAYFFDEGGEPLGAGENLQNPAYAQTLTAIAEDGAEVFYTGEIAESIVDKVQDSEGERTPGVMTMEDLADYEVVLREPVCAEYRDRELCSMPPPSSGGLTVAQTLAMLSEFDLAELGPEPGAADGGLPSAEAIHLISEAERLAYADRNAYIADPDFVPLPGGSDELLLDPEYLAERAGMISPEESMGTAEPGDFTEESPSGSDNAPEDGTSHISIADADGNVAAMTTTIEAGFGSFHMTETGFLLNNELTDFDAEPVDESDEPVANRVEADKRPRSSMSPTLIFDLDDGERGVPVGAVGSPGGSLIIQYVAKAVVGMTDWEMDPQEAISMANFGADNEPTTGIGGEHPSMATAEGQGVVEELEELGHEVSTDAQVSGASALVRIENGWLGGADPRREGIVLGAGVED